MTSAGHSACKYKQWCIQICTSKIHRNISIKAKSTKIQENRLFHCDHDYSSDIKRKKYFSHPEVKSAMKIINKKFTLNKKYLAKDTQKIITTNTILWYFNGLHLLLQHSLPQPSQPQLFRSHDCHPHKKENSGLVKLNMLPTLKTYVNSCTFDILYYILKLWSQKGGYLEWKCYMKKGWWSWCMKLKEVRKLL